MTKHRRPVTQRYVLEALAEHAALPSDAHFFLELLVQQFFRVSEEEAAWADSILADMYSDSQGVDEEPLEAEVMFGPTEDTTPPDYSVTQTPVSSFRGPVALACGRGEAGSGDDRHKADV